MNCNCYQKFEEKLREHTGDPKASLSSGFVEVENELKHVPVITAYYRDKKKNGELKNMRVAHDNIIAKYCPFCGKPVV
jgi:hypothetical protein